MSNKLPNFLDIEKELKKNKENFEKNVPDSLYSEYLDLRQQLKELGSKRQAELNSIYKKFDAEKKELSSKAKDCLEKMSELTGISTWDLTSSSLVGGYYFND